MRMRLTPEDRANHIFQVAFKLAERPRGLHRLTRGLIAQKVKCAPSLVSHYFIDMNTLKSRVIHAAVDATNLSIIGQALALGMPEVSSVSQSLKTKAIKGLL